MKGQLGKRFPCFGSFGYKLFSWWDMLQIFADQFHRFSSVLVKFFLLPDLAYDPQNMQELSDSLGVISETCLNLGLKLSVNQANLICEHIHSGTYTADLLQNELQQLHTRIYEELQGELFLYVPKDKADLAVQDYWRDPEIERAFPSTLHEFIRAGCCFAYDEPTACVFHLMRIVDTGLKATARSLGIVYDSRGWSSIGQEIHKRMEQKYSLKTDEWKRSEPLYANILTDIQAIAKAHRNEVIHRIECIYNDREAHELIILVRGFIRHLAKGGIRE
jgi:hypothetical protein